MGTAWSTGYRGRRHPAHPQSYARYPARGDTPRNATARPFLQIAGARTRHQQLPSRGPDRRAARRLPNHLDGNIVTTYPRPRSTPAGLRAFTHQSTSGSASARSAASRSLGGSHHRPHGWLPLPVKGCSASRCHHPTITFELAETWLVENVLLHARRPDYPPYRPTRRVNRCA
jgi:hypothetical protein